MPYLQMQTSAEFNPELGQEICQSLSSIVSKNLGKPEAYVMVSLSDAQFVMNGQVGPAAFVDLRSIGGLTAEKNRELSAQICQVIEQKLGVASNRIYLNFRNIERNDWGYDGSTFG